MRSKSEVVGTFPSLTQFLESIKSQVSVFDITFDNREYANRQRARDAVGKAVARSLAVRQEPERETGATVR
jgi:hypothetical protein